MKRGCNNCADDGGGIICTTTRRVVRNEVLGPVQRKACHKHRTWKEADPEDYARDHAYFDEEKGKWVYWDFGKNEMTPEFRRSCHGPEEKPL